MTFPIAFAPARPVRRTFAVIAATTAVAFLAASSLSAQQPAPTPAPKPAPRPAPKAQPKQQPAPQPQAQPAQPAQPPQGQAAGQQQGMPVVYLPWTKFCGKEQTQGGPKDVCVTVKEARLESGQFLAGAALYEMDGEATKLFRITLPLGMQLPQGTRVTLDKDEPISAPFIMCAPGGCMAQTQVKEDFVSKLKKGQQLTLQGINPAGQLATYAIPLVDFAKANEGPPTDPKEVEQQQKKLQEELQRRAEEARKKLETPATPPAGQKR
jgi:invasion protein IalB